MEGNPQAPEGVNTAPEGDDQEDQDLGGPAEDLENDPAYNPDDEGLKDIKGG